MRWSLLQSAGLLAGMLPAAPAQPRTTASHDVRRFGARGDGVRDDTAAFQDAIDALPADGGGRIVVPAGRYVIDPLRSVRLRSQMRLVFLDGAVLVAKPNAAERAYVLTLHGVEDVAVIGGRIIGERAAHRGTGGEWGHGVMIRGAQRVRISDMRISQCWGDGISIGGIGGKGGSGVVPSRDITISRVVCTGNRRQGLTIGRSRRVRVHDCEFSDTAGTAPASGIDVEPDAGDRAEDVLIARCHVHGNQGPGIQLYKRVVQAVVRGCTIEDNGGHGVLLIGARHCDLSGNRIRGNGLAGVGLRPGTSDVAVSGNRFGGNCARARRKRPSLRCRNIDIAKNATGIRIAGDNRDEA
jgi:polygalacturonase